MIQHRSRGVHICVIAERTGLLPPTVAGHQSAERLQVLGVLHPIVQGPVPQPQPAHMLLHLCHSRGFGKTLTEELPLVMTSKVSFACEPLPHTTWPPRMSLVKDTPPDSSSSSQTRVGDVISQSLHLSPTLRPH